MWDAIGYADMADAPTADLYGKRLRLAQLIEELGFHSYFVIEHQNSDVGRIASPSVFLTAVALRTSVLRIGAVIWQLPLHNPMRLAQEVAMLDQLSRGRVEFGTGIGVHEHEFLRWGMDYTQRGPMSGEAMEIIKLAWNRDEVTYEGKYWRYDEALPAPKPYQQPYPPIWVGAHGQAALEFAAKGNYHVAQNNDVDDGWPRSSPTTGRSGTSAGTPAPSPGSSCSAAFTWRRPTRRRGRRRSPTWWGQGRGRW